MIEWNQLAPGTIFMLSSTLATLFPVGVGWKHYPSLTLAQRWTFWFCVASLLLMLYANVLFIHLTNNLFIGHAYLLIQFVCLTRVYQLEVKEGLSRKLFGVLIVGFTAFSLFNTFYLQPLTVHNTYARNVASIVLSIVSIYYFFQLVRRPFTVKVERLFMFWFSAGVLLYFLSSLFIFTVSNVIQPFKSVTIPVWTIHAGLLWIFFLALGIGLWIHHKPLK